MSAEGSSELAASSSDDMKSSKSSDFHLTEADRLKEIGNEHYTHKEYVKAMRQYHLCLMHVRAVQNGLRNVQGMAQLLAPQQQQTDVTEEEVAQQKQHADQLALKCYNNLAACILNGEQRSVADYERAAGYCDRVLELDAANEKAVFRKGAALCEAGHNEKAITVLRTCTTQNAEAQRYLQRCHRQIELDRKRVDATIKQNFMRAQQREQSRNAAHVNGDAPVANGQSPSQSLQ